eukprot:1240251-Prymnesium_polylepis.1
MIVTFPPPRTSIAPPAGARLSRTMHSLRVRRPHPRVSRRQSNRAARLESGRHHRPQLRPPSPTRARSDVVACHLRCCWREPPRCCNRQPRRRTPETCKRGAPWCTTKYARSVGRVGAFGSPMIHTCGAAQGSLGFGENSAYMGGRGLGRGQGYGSMRLESSTGIGRTGAAHLARHCAIVEDSDGRVDFMIATCHIDSNGKSGRVCLRPGQSLG